MNEVISLKGVSFDRKYFHSATLIRGTDPAKEKYYGNLLVAVNFIIPNIGGNQGILNTTFLKGDNPVETIDLYLSLLEKLLKCMNDVGTIYGISGRDELIKDYLTADEKALSKEPLAQPTQEGPTVPQGKGDTVPREDPKRFG